MSKITLVFISVFSFIISFANIFIYNDYFYSVSFFVVFLIGVFGFYKNNNIWFHESSHIITSGIIVFVLGGYEVFNYFSQWLNYWMTKEDFPSLNWTIVISFFVFLFIFLKEKKNIKSKSVKN
ncbi:MAG TPA: hypothetical protein PLS66_04425 [Tepiditoga sp.]|nr:hypothetical protein [Thermotogota bacterium]HOO74517.1 hypothetical protein [Tepiditoga sp.]